MVRVSIRFSFSGRINVKISNADCTVRQIVQLCIMQKVKCEIT